jgi:hypothetical protein
MEQTILLDYSENLSRVEAEEKELFLKNILELSGVPLDFWTTPLTTEARAGLRDVFLKYAIKVVDVEEGPLHIYLDGNEIGRFNAPRALIKRDISKEQSKQLFIEMRVETWSVFEQSD